MRLLFYILALTGLLTAASYSHVRVHEDFESTAPGAIGNLQGWVHSSGTAVVQTNVAQEGFQALEMIDSSVTHPFSETGTTCWMRFQARINSAPASPPAEWPSDTRAAFYINTNLNIVVCSNEIPVELAAEMPTNAWTRFDVYCDYDDLTWNLSMDGITIGAGLGLCSSNTGPASIKISTSGNEPVYFDAINLTDYEQVADAPDRDADGVPDWWEQKYFGHPAAVNANEPSTNGGLSYIETYVAGVNPLTADPWTIQLASPGNIQWSSLPGRIYTLEWTPSLASNFQPIATAAWPTNTLPHLQAEPVGFYRLNVGIK